MRAWQWVGAGAVFMAAVAIGYAVPTWLAGLRAAPRAERATVAPAPAPTPTPPPPPQAARPEAPTPPALPPFGMTPPGPMLPPLPPGGAPPALPPVPPGMPPLLLVPPGPFFHLPGPPGSPNLPPGPPPSPAPQPPGPGAPWPGAPPNASEVGRVRPDVPYGPEALQRLDLYLPEGDAPVPMLLLVHGGGWSLGDKSELRWLGEKLAQQGILVAVANYRLSPAVKHPAHAQDVARAAAWLYRAGAQFGGDPARLYLGGHSAGAHLAALVALDERYLQAAGLAPGAVRGVIGVAGAVYDLDARYAATPLAGLLAPAFGRDPGRWKDAAPLAYVDQKAPPFLLVHGLNDTEAPVTSAQALAAALEGAGVAVRLELLPGHDHRSALVAAVPSIRAFVQ